MISQYWTTSVQCARCKRAELVEQPGHQPGGWVVVAYTEKQPFNARQPQAAPQTVYVPYPFCGPVCASLFALTRAWGSLRSKEEQEKFRESLRSIKWLEDMAEEIVPS